MKRTLLELPEPGETRSLALLRFDFRRTADPMRSVRLAISALALLLSAGCGAHTTTLAQTPLDERAVREGEPVFAAALTFAFQQPGWEPPDQWNEHVRRWSEAYLAELGDAGSSLGARRPQPLPPGTSPGRGLVIVSTVRDIVRGNAIASDDIVVDVVFLDASTQKPTLKATLDVSSLRMSGPEGYTFGGRIKFACKNLADAIVDALRKGHFEFR